MRVRVWVYRESVRVWVCRECERVWRLDDEYMMCVANHMIWQKTLNPNIWYGFSFMIIELSSADDRIEMNENDRKRMFFEYFSINFHDLIPIFLLWILVYRELYYHMYDKWQ